MADIYKSKFTGQEIDDILTNASNVTNIEANPSGEATEELTKLKIGDTIYSIPEQSGGGETPTNRIKFTINGIPYEADEGMSWADWVASDYSYGAYNFAGGFSNIVTTKYGYPQPNYGFVSTLYVFNVSTGNYAGRTGATLSNHELNIVANGVYSARALNYGGGSN